MREKTLNKIIKLYEYWHKVKIDRSNPQFVELCQKDWFISLCKNMNRYGDAVKQLRENQHNLWNIYDGVPAREKMKYCFKNKILNIKIDIHLVLLSQIDYHLFEIFGGKNE